MTKVNQDYIIGLDIGTNSAGYAVTDKKNNILRLHGKNAIGARLFREGNTAADRRGFRTTRRRLKRRKWRLRLLEEIFDSEMIKVDRYFFARMKESEISPLDNRKQYTSIIFPTKEEEKEFYDKYPTIYHLRDKLMTEDKKFDLREVYLAIHHIVKYRGNFLQDTPVNNFNASKIEVRDSLEKINEYLEKAEIEAVQFTLDNSDDIRGLLTDKTTPKQDKVKQITNLLLPEIKNKEIKKLTRNIAKQVVNAILGYKVSFDILLNKEIEKEDQNDWRFKLSDVDADVKLDALLSIINETEQNLILEVKNLFSAVTLAGLVDEGKTLSQTMIRKYNDHKDHLRLLKDVINDHSDKEKAKNLRLAYDLYINNHGGRVLEAKKVLKKNRLNREDFEKIIKNNLDDLDTAAEIKRLIDLGTFMPKQRTNANGVIPYQLQQIELDKIIKNQSKYYPFLAEKNPIDSHQDQAPYKLDELIRFRVPYYVGPLITEEEQQNTSGANFAWMIRKETGRITPWNFDQKVDRMSSADKFIKRMTTKDTYLFGEDVLPAHSLIYQEFTVLNELNNIRINDKKLTTEEKRDIFDNLFKRHASVSSEQLKNFLKTNYNSLSVEITGLSDDKKFNSSLSTYYQLSKIKGLKEKLDNQNYQADIENIIEWSTIFEDRNIFIEKLKEIAWLSDAQRSELSKLRYQGWGRLSDRLLTKLVDEDGQNILQTLWNSQQNFMQIINQADFKSQIEQANKEILGNKDNNIEDILEDAYTSPANKKAIRQVVAVVDDIVKAAGHKAPAQIAIEFARDKDKDPKLSKSRGNKLSKVYEEVATELVDESVKEELTEAITSQKLLKDKYYLYFMQGGRDAYTGERINIDEITTAYQIDHILPQAFVKDDSLDNRVLVRTKLNAEKSDDVPVKHYAHNLVPNENITVKELWKKWQENGLISKKKLNNLLMDPGKINKYQRQGFINRQLVETSQIIKLVAAILQAKYPDTEIISVKASYNHAIRTNKLYNLYKSREVNDYHHAIDAYLTTICANYLYQTYPKLRPYFVYGEYQKFRQHPEIEKDILRSFRTFNFIWPLLKVDHSNDLTVYKSDEVVFDRQKDIIDKLKRAYEFKYMVISRETYVQDGALFNMTLYPRKNRDTKTRKNLIPKKKNLNPEIYGGYSGNKDAFMSLIKVSKGKNIKYKIVGIPVRFASKLKLIKNKKNYSLTLYKIIEKQGFKNFEILKEKIPYRQLVKADNEKFQLGSSTYLYNGKQLTLSNESMRIITGDFLAEENRKNSYVKVYDEIINKVDAYLPLFDINNFRRSLHQKRDIFITLNEEDMRQVIIKILNGLHDNATIPKISELKISTPFGMMQRPSGIILPSNAELIYQSPSGLFEKRVKIKNL